MRLFYKYYDNIGVFLAFFQTYDILKRLTMFLKVIL